MESINAQGAVSDAGSRSKIDAIAETLANISRTQEALAKQVSHTHDRTAATRTLTRLHGALQLDEYSRATKAEFQAIRSELSASMGRLTTTSAPDFNPAASKLLLNIPGK